MEEATAKRIQNFGEQHPQFHSKDMREWRKEWRERARIHIGYNTEKSPKCATRKLYGNCPPWPHG